MKSYGRSLHAAAVIFIICSFVLPVYAEPTDIKGHWARNEINRWIERGILFGDTNGRFNPNDYISRAEFVAIVNRIFKYQDQSGTVFSDIKGSEWYAADIDKAAAAGILKGSGGKARPKDPVSRQEAAVILVRVFGLEAADKNAVNSFSDASAIPSWSKDALSAMCENGYISGLPGNIIAPAGKTSRAEAAKMIDNIISDLKSKPGAYTGVIEGNLVVNTADAVLESMTVNGNLYLTQGIGSGSVTLDNVTVKGVTIVTGGGDHSIIIKNSTLRGNLIVYKKDGKIRIVAQENTDIPTVLMQSGGTLVESDAEGNGFGDVQIVKTVLQGQDITLEGSFDEVSVEAPGIGVEVVSGSVVNLMIKDSAAGSNITIEEGAAVDTLTIDASAGITGKGTVNTANINVDGIAMEQTPEVINLKEGVVLGSDPEAALGDSSGDGDVPEDDAAVGVGAGDGGGEVGDGGGLPGGGDVPGGGIAQTLQIVSAYATVGGDQVQADKGQDGNWIVNLTGKEETAMFTELRINASADVTEAEVSYWFFTETIHFTGGTANIIVHDMMGVFDTGDPGVSILSIRSLKTSTFNVVLKNGIGGSVTLTINLNV